MSAAADVLLAELDSAGDAAAREALLLASGASPELLREVNSALVYRAMKTEVDAAIAVDRAQFEAFALVLASLADDAARLKAIEARSPEFLSAWSAWRAPDMQNSANAYLAALKAPA